MEFKVGDVVSVKSELLKMWLDVHETGLPINDPFRNKSGPFTVTSVDWGDWEMQTVQLENISVHYSTSWFTTEEPPPLTVPQYQRKFREVK